MSKRLLLLTFVLLALAGPAMAHGDNQSSDPEPGASLGKAPKKVSLSFSEAPAPESVFEITDGCDRPVAGDPSFDGRDVSVPVVTAFLGNLGAPGEWKVNFRVISAEDGHTSKDSFTFSVRGTPDCSGSESPEASPSSSTATEPEASGDEDQGSGFPVVPVAIGAAVLVGAGFGLRSITGRREP